MSEALDAVVRRLLRPLIREMIAEMLEAPPPPRGLRRKASGLTLAGIAALRVAWAVRPPLPLPEIAARVSAENGSAVSPAQCSKKAHELNLGPRVLPGEQRPGHQRASVGPRSLVFDEARVAALRAAWAVVPPLGMEEVAARVNAVSPGLRLASAMACSDKAHALGLPRRQPPSPPVRAVGTKLASPVWGDGARDRVLRDGWKRGDSDAVLLAAVNAVDAHLLPVRSVGALKSHASSMGLGLRPGRPFTRPVASPQLPPPKLAAAPDYRAMAAAPVRAVLSPAADGVVRVDYATAKAEAARFGIAFDGRQMDLLNKRLAEAGRPEMVIVG